MLTQTNIGGVGGNGRMIKRNENIRLDGPKCGRHLS
jgi:hypothetical protein